MLNPDEQALVEFVQKHAVNLPAAERAAVYRGLADLTEVQELAQAMFRKARIMEEAEVKCAELDLDFTPKPKKPKHDGHHNGGNKS